MPANRGLGGPHWTPKPDFKAGFQVEACEPQPHIVKTAEALARYVELVADLPEITAYEPAMRAELARYTAEQLFHPSYEIGVDAAVIVDHYVQGTEFLPRVEATEPTLRTVFVVTRTPLSSAQA